MAFLANPSYGAIPGAPQGLNWWEGPQFFMSGLPQPLPAAAPPAAPLAATPTPQDVAAYRGAAALTDTGGGQPGGGGPGSGPGGLGGASGGGQDRTTSGYQGVYAQSPVDIDSRFGQAGSTIGMGIGSLAGIPGPGTALGALGGALDASRYNGTLGQYGLPGTVNPWTSALAAAMPGIPFTDLNLGRLFGLQSARQQMDSIINGLPPGLYNDQGYGAMAANASHNPGAPFGNTGWGPGMNPTTGQFPPGFLENEARLTIAANPDIFGSSATKGAFDAGAYADAMAGKGGTPAESTGTAADKEAGGGGKGSDSGQSTGSAGDKGDVGAGQEGGSGGSSRDGGDGGYKYQGGLIGRPPGSYAAGGTVGRVAGRMPTRYEPPPIDVVPRDYMSDAPGAQYMNDQPMAPPPPSAREQMIQDAMQDYLRGQSRTRYPEGFAAGGMVPSSAPGDNITPAAFASLRAINPPGPDDQLGALQTGEGVLTRGAIGRYPGLLEAANAGTLDPKRVQGMLGRMPASAARARLR